MQNGLMTADAIGLLKFIQSQRGPDSGLRTRAVRNHFGSAQIPR